MRQLTFILTALTLAAFQTDAGIFDWFFGAVNDDDTARKEAEFFVMDGVSHHALARVEKVTIIDKYGPFYLFHVVLTSPGAGVERDRSSYLVCFKWTERVTEYRILTAIQYASDPPTENEIATDKCLNRWPSSPPYETGNDLPRHIEPPGLSILLDMCRAGAAQ